MRISQTGSVSVPVHFVRGLAEHCSRRHVIAFLALTLALATSDPSSAGPRVGESGLGLIEGHAYSAPYEDVTLASK